MFAFSFCLASSLLLVAQAHDDCIIEALTEDSTFDLNPFYDLVDGDYHAFLEEQYAFDLMVCGKAKDSSANCSTARGAVCAYEENLPDRIYIDAMALWEIEPYPFLEQIDQTDPSKGVTMTFQNGHFLDPLGIVTVQLIFPCDPTVTTMSDTVQVASNNVTGGYDFTWQASNWSCPAPHKIIIINPVNSESGGTVFIIMLFSATSFYCLIGFMYKTVVKGTSGCESIPNVDFWRSLPGLVCDGCRYSTQCVREKLYGRDDYANL